jgi:hypothetical protein
VSFVSQFLLSSFHLFAFCVGNRLSASLSKNHFFSVLFSVLGVFSSIFCSGLLSVVFHFLGIKLSTKLSKNHFFSCFFASVGVLFSVLSFFTSFIKMLLVTGNHPFSTMSV